MSALRKTPKKFLLFNKKWHNQKNAIRFKMIVNAVIEKDEFGYFAYVPSLGGCVSQGKSYEEAIKNITEATELYLESLKANEIQNIGTRNSAIIPIEVALNA